ncbi:MAG: isocitrate/isopropylmalate family dehydrogenase [Pseudobdellovibrionaceae bacterium]|jgi:isocitrate dehydrogenase|nr:isocitrate/isopropylmalate family dehydrogenase [Pseudobdellovibrionaceae bacterium]
MPAPFKLGGSIVDMTGDGVWPHMSKEIRDELIAPFFQIDWKVHDISVYARDKSNDAALDNAIEDLKTHKAAVKGPTITPTIEETKKLGLSKKLDSPNGIIRRAINGAAILRNTIEIDGIGKFAPLMRDVTIARQAVGGIYGAPNVAIPSKGTVKIVFEGEDGTTENLVENRKVAAGVLMLTTETDSSIRDYAHAVFAQALAMNKSVIFAAKDTINPVYDGRFIDIFNQIFKETYSEKFTTAGLTFADKVQLIDAVVSKIPQGKMNGTVIALKNYDGDVVSDQVAGEHKSLGLMDSTLVSADGTLLADPPHGTAPDLEPAWHEKGILLANPAAHIFAYAEAIRHKAELNGQAEGIVMAKKLKQAVILTIEKGLQTGSLTGDLAPDRSKSISGQQFIANVRDVFRDMIIS